MKKKKIPPQKEELPVTAGLDLRSLNSIFIFPNSLCQLDPRFRADGHGARHMRSLGEGGNSLYSNGQKGLD